MCAGYLSNIEWPLILGVFSFMKFFSGYSLLVARAACKKICANLILNCRSPVQTRVIFCLPERYRIFWLILFRDLVISKVLRTFCPISKVTYKNSDSYLTYNMFSVSQSIFRVYQKNGKQTPNSILLINSLITNKSGKKVFEGSSWISKYCRCY